MAFWDGGSWVSETNGTAPARPHSKMLGAARAASLISLVVLALTVSGGSAAAGGGKPGGSTSSPTLEVRVLDGVDNVANWGERVGFVFSTTATDRPFVGVRCWQGSNWVLDGYTGYFPTYLSDPWVTLDSTYWAADVP